MTVLVKNLVGQNVAGKLAQVTRQMHIDSGVAPKRVRILKSVTREKDKRYGWFIMLRWEPDYNSLGIEHFDCGFSGMQEDSRDCQTWSIELIEGSQQ